MNLPHWVAPTHTQNLGSSKFAIISNNNGSSLMWRFNLVSCAMSTYRSSLCLVVLVIFSGNVSLLPTANAMQLPAACLETALVAGPCRAALPRWSYDAASMKCAPDYLARVYSSTAVGNAEPIVFDCQAFESLCCVHLSPVYMVYRV